MKIESEIKTSTPQYNTGMESTRGVIEIIENGHHEYDYNIVHYFVGICTNEYDSINIKVTDNIWEATKFSQYESPSKIESLISFLRKCNIYNSFEVKYIKITLNYEI